MRLLSLIAAGSLLVASGAAANAATVTETIKINATAKAVWDFSAADFCDIAHFHPAVESCVANYAENTRTLTLVGGGTIVEKQTADEKGSGYSYEIVESPLPVANYRSSFTVKADGDASTVTWTGTFDAKGDEEAAKKVIDGIYTSGLAALKKKF